MGGDSLKSGLSARLLSKQEDEAERASLGLATLKSRWRATRRLAVFLFLTLIVSPTMLTVLALRWRYGFERIPMLHHRLCCKAMGFRLRVIGEMEARRPVLFVSNHTSYLDIPLIGGIVPGCFIAKAEVGQWPFFGFLAKLQRTVFVDRRRSAARKQSAELQERVAGGDNLILFPEGTSNDGNRVLPFKSSLFAVAAMEAEGSDGQKRPMMVQPVSIAYRALDGMPMGRHLRPYFAWYGDMDLVPHLVEALSLGMVDVEITFQEPVRLDEFESRKALADHCQQAVEAGVAATLSGHRHAPPAPPRDAPA